MDADRTYLARYLVIGVVIIVLFALLFPVSDGLSALGVVRDKTYLLILQDNSELQNTGGLMDCIGVVTVHDGAIKDLDIYYTSAYLNGTVKLEGPQSISAFFGNEHAAVYFSNVQYDFASFAPIMQANFYNETGRAVDGTIAIDSTALQALMNVTGPVNASGQIITSLNVVDQLHYYSGIASGERAPLTHLLSELALTISRTALEGTIPQKLAFLNVVRQMGQEKHIQIYLAGNKLLQSFNGAWERPDGDFIYALDTNLGSGKADFGVDRGIDSRVTLFANGSSRSTVTLRYANNNWWDYNVLSTIIVPPGAQLTRVNDTAQGIEGPLVQNYTDFTAISAHLGISAGATGTVTYAYTLPKKFDTGSSTGHYNLDVQKQAGVTHYTLNASVTPPAGTKLIVSKNVGSGTYTDDVRVESAYVKKF